MSDRSGKDHPIIGFSRFEEAGSFFLHEAFRYAHYSAEYEVAGIIFGKRIMSIDPEPGWIPPIMGETLEETLEAEDEDKHKDDVTISRLAEAWHLAQAEAASSGIKLQRSIK